MSCARQRWNMLAECIVTKREKTDLHQSINSIRRFSSYGIFQVEPIADGNDIIANDNINGDANWFQYSCPGLTDRILFIRHISAKWSPETLRGFNNTGNVCVWTSEEVMAYYCLKNKHIFEQRSICELGGGMSCLAGILVASSVVTERVLLTDGNEDSASNLSEIIKANRTGLKSTNVSSRCLRWPSTENISYLHEQFDFILCADCLFFRDTRSDLIAIMSDLLKPQGNVIVFAPHRGKTLEEFLNMSKEAFTVELHSNYDDHIWKLHNLMSQKGIDSYDENLHYPLMLRMTKHST